MTFQIEDLCQKIEEITFEYALRGVQGWLSPDEKKALYALALHTTGPVLEIGSWVGLSTACIALGIRDQGRDRLFITTDLNPTLEHFRPIDNDRIAFFLPNEPSARGSCSVEQFEQQVKPVISQDGGVIAQLRKNLTALGLISLVTIIEGEFTRAPHLDYQLIFCDATHTPYEISLTMPALQPFLSAGTILACHDIDATNEAELKGYLSFSSSFKIDSLFIGQIAGDEVSLSPSKANSPRKESSSTPPTVSVILPTYNRGHLIVRAILSVLNQSYSDFELLIVDDGSTDQTQEVIARLDDSRIRYIRHKQNQGASAARNTGIKASLGRFLAFQDSDDEWLPNKLAQQVESLTQSPPKVGVVYSRFWHIHGHRKSLIPSQMAKWVGWLPFKGRNLAGDLYDSLLRGNFITPQATLVRKECFEKAGLFDERMPRFQDWELWLRIAKHYHFQYIDEPLVSLYFTPRSISANQRALAEAFELILLKHAADVQANPHLWAHIKYAKGDLLYQSGELSKGKEQLFQAVRLSPYNLVYRLAALLSFCGPKVYTKIVKLLGISYAP